MLLRRFLSYHSILLAILSGGVLTLGIAAGAEPDVQSGPLKGDTVAALKVHDVTGANAGKDVDIAALRAAKPTIYLFVQAQQWSRPMARFMRGLDAELADVANEAQLVAVWLTDDQKKSIEYLPRAQNSLKLKSTAFTVYRGDASGPPEWGINSDAFLSVVVANKKKVAASFGYLSVNETVVPEVKKALVAAVGGDQ